MYYHKFHMKQPDLNYRNPGLVQEMKDILTFWLDKGVSGFRVDAIPTLFEILPTADGYLPDELPTNNPLCDEFDACSLNHIYTEDRAETYEMSYQWRELMDSYKKQHGGSTRLLMAGQFKVFIINAQIFHSNILALESYAPINMTILYYTNGKVNGPHFPFNFQLIVQLNNRSTAKDYRDAVDSWLDATPKGYQPNWVVSRGKSL